MICLGSCFTFSSNSFESLTFCLSSTPSNTLVFLSRNNEMVWRKSKYDRTPCSCCFDCPNLVSRVLSVLRLLRISSSKSMDWQSSYAEDLLSCPFAVRNWRKCGTTLASLHVSRKLISSSNFRFFKSSFSNRRTSLSTASPYLSRKMFATDFDGGNRKRIINKQTKVNTLNFIMLHRRDSTFCYSSVFVVNIHRSPYCFHNNHQLNVQLYISDREQGSYGRRDLMQKRHRT